MATDNDLRIKVLKKMIRKGITGNHKVTVDTAKTWVATHDRGRAEGQIRAMVSDPEAPVEAYGGSRDNVRLTSVDEAVEYIKDLGGDPPWFGRSPGDD